MWIRRAVVLVGVGLLASAGWGAEEGGLPVLHVVGDSTANNNFNGGRGWGNELAPLFDAEVIAVVNRARGVRSSRTYWSEGLWDEVLEGMKPGDYVLLQFGHNDPGGVGVGMDRGSLPGLGEETATITNRAGRVETVHTYGWYMRAYIAQAREKGAVRAYFGPDHTHTSPAFTFGGGGLSLTGCWVERPAGVGGDGRVHRDPDLQPQDQEDDHGSYTIHRTVVQGTGLPTHRQAGFGAPGPGHQSPRHQGPI